MRLFKSPRLTIKFEGIELGFVRKVRRKLLYYDLSRLEIRTVSSSMKNFLSGSRKLKGESYF